MSVDALPSPQRTAIPPKFANGEEWHHALGYVPLSRIIFNPLPGTATEQDLVRLTDAEDHPCELIDGTLVEKAGSFYESVLAARLASELIGYVLKQRLGIITGATAPFRLRDGLVRMADVAFYSMSQFPDRRIPREPISNLVPDLAIEFLDVQNTTAEMRLKLREYFEAGTALAWLVDPEAESVSIHRSTKGLSRILNIDDSLDGEGVIPGFSMPLVDLFHCYPVESRVSENYGQAHRI